MATPLEALFTATLGVIGGLVGASILERVKAGVASLDAELVRLDMLEDDLFDIFALPTDDDDRGSMLRQLNSRRRRLGQNIKRKVADSVAYQACKVELVNLNGFIAKAEDGEPLSEALETAIEQSVSRLRSNLRRSSKMAKAFALLRGEA